MKKSKLLILGLIALLLAGGLALVSCDQDKECKEGERDCIHTSSEYNIPYGKQHKDCDYTFCNVDGAILDDPWEVHCNCKG